MKTRCCTHSQCVSQTAHASGICHGHRAALILADECLDGYHDACPGGPAIRGKIGILCQCPHHTTVERCAECRLPINQHGSIGKTIGCERCEAELCSADCAQGHEARHGGE